MYIYIGLCVLFVLYAWTSIYIYILFVRGITWGQRQFGRTWRWLVSLLQQLRGREVCARRDFAVCCQPWWRCNGTIVSGAWEEDSTGAVRESSKPDCFERSLGGGFNRNCPRIIQTRLFSFWMIVSHQNLQNIARKRRKSLFGQARELRFFLCQACARPVVEAISFRMGSSEAFVVLACRSTTLLQGSSMAGTTLTLYVGLTPSDAHKILMEHQAVQPHWKDRWGLKTTAMEARTRVFFCHVLMWAGISIPC